MGLKAYRAKRDFSKTPEPEAGGHAEPDYPLFVVHKHAARALHYDLRLELAGLLKSWAIPKGPSLDPSVKRLAVMVEDHPFEYREFEGVIPKGNYGAGSVIIWDRGTYHHPLAVDRKENSRLLQEGLKKGDLKFVLEGEKLRGEFALVKTRQGDNSWILIKKKDRFGTEEDILKEGRSVVSGRSIEEIGAAVSERSPGYKSEETRSRVISGDELAEAPLNPMPHSSRPMLASAARVPFDHPDWIFEVKWDGFRAMAETRGEKVSLYSRNLVPLDREFPPVVQALQTIRKDALLDGEIVVLDAEGRADFEMLQNYRKTGRGHLVYYAFDLLHFDGHDLTGLPLLKRKKILKEVLPQVPELRFSEHITAEGRLFFSAAKEKGLEGIMAKASASVYLPGRRSSKWLKIKTRLTQEAVIAGFTEPGGSRDYFGSLVLGAFEDRELKYIGHSGGGFSRKDLKDIHDKLVPLVHTKCPFRDAPETAAPTRWVKPQIVCEVAFQGWTKEGLLRQPTFLKLREDKDAHEAAKEKTESTPA